MSLTIDRMTTVRVAEVMNNNVLVVRDSDTMQTAAKTIQSNHVSGVPVSDQFGHCVGVLSLADFVKSERNCELRECDVWLDLVHDHMTSPAVSVAPTNSLVDAAKLMCTRHVHRLPVVDEFGQLVGIVSSLDVMGTLVSESSGKP